MNIRPSVVGHMHNFYLLSNLSDSITKYHFKVMADSDIIYNILQFYVEIFNKVCRYIKKTILPGANKT